MQGVGSFPAPGADALAVTANWVAWRSGATLYAASLDPANGFVPRPIITGAVGKPALAGNLLVFELDSRIEAFDLAHQPQDPAAPREGRRAARARPSRDTG